MATFNLYTSPKGSQFTSTIGMNEETDKNDFSVFIVADENVSGLEQSDIGVSAGYSVQSFEGSHSVYKAVIRPLETAGVLTVSLGADVVNEGNPAVSQDVRVSTTFPDADAEMGTLLFDTGDSGHDAIAVSPTRIYLTDSSGTDAFMHDGTDASETTTRPIGHTGIDYINGGFLAVLPRTGGRLQSALYRYDGAGTELWRVSTDLYIYGITHTPLGYTTSSHAGDQTQILPYDFEDNSDFIDANVSTAAAYRSIAYQDNILYYSRENNAAYGEILDDGTIEFRRQLNIDFAGTYAPLDIAIYRDTWYFIDGGEVRTIDLKKYRPMAKNTKTHIPVVLVQEGHTIDLTEYAPDASDFIFDTGFDKPTYLSINANNELVIATHAISETTPVLVKCRGINYIDSVAFSFYLIIRQRIAPQPREVDNLSMRANSTFDLHQIVDADTITFESGQTQPTGSSITDGIFTIGTVGGDAYFTATRDGLFTNFQFNVDIVQTPNPDNFSEQFRHRVEIRGIDVTDDVPTFPEISKTTDAIALNEYRNDTATIILNDDNGKYNPDIDDNFWQTNTLNFGGFREPIKVFVENLINGVWVSSLLFSGVIYEEAESISAIEARLRCREVAYLLRQENVSDFGTNEKWDALRQQSDEASFEGVYQPENALTPMQVGTGKAWRDRTELDISRIALQSEGQAQANTAYMTDSDLRTAGGYLSENPILRFKTRHLSEDVRFLWNQLSINKGIYNTLVDLPDVVLTDPFILNRGSVSFSVENTRNTRLVTDWVYDSTNQRVLMLLSNPEAHIADMLVSYRVESDSFRTLYTFDKDVKAWRIERRNATNYYVLTSSAITQDRSAQTLPRTDDKTAYAYDSRAEGSLIRIHHYNASTGVLTEHVREDDTHNPQLGIHYHAGFENTIYIDEFEGIVSAQNANLKWYDNNLYYRYAKDGEFGVARANTSGTTTALITQSDLNYNNWLNFAFDIDVSNGDTFMVHASGMSSESSLVIRKRTVGGVVSTVLTDTKTLQAFSDLDGGGAYLGCHEALYHNDNLYMVVPIQRVDEDSTSPVTYSRSREKSAGCILYSCDVTAGTPTLTVIEKYDFVTLSACNLIVHDDAVHYIEQPRVATQFRPINPDL